MSACKPAPIRGCTCNPWNLTHRELEVLEAAAEGLQDKHIADRLTVTINTVSRHLCNIRNKMNESSRVSICVRYALWRASPANCRRR